MRKLKKALAVFVLLLILCGNMAGITVSADFIYGDFKYRILADGTVEIAEYIGKEENVIVPSQINGRKVTEIGYRVFNGSNVKSIKIADGVKTVYAGAFNYCNALKEIHIPLSVTKFHIDAIYDCDNLTDIYYAGSEKRFESIFWKYEKSHYFCGTLYAQAVEYYLYGSINVHYHYKFFGVTFTLMCVVLVFVGIWLYGRKIRKNELQKT